MTILIYMLLGSFSISAPQIQQEKPLKWEVDRDGNFVVHWKYEENSKSRDGKRFLDQRHVEMIWTAPPKKQRPDRYRHRNAPATLYEVRIKRLKWIYEDDAFRVDLQIHPGKPLKKKSSIKRVFAAPFYYSKGNPLTRYDWNKHKDPRNKEKADRKTALDFLARRVAALEKLIYQRYQVIEKRGGQIQIVSRENVRLYSRQSTSSLFDTFFSNPSFVWKDLSRGAKWNLAGKEETPFEIYRIAPKPPVIHVGSTRAEEISFYTKSRGDTSRGKFQFDMDILFSRKGYLKTFSAVLKHGTVKKTMTLSLKKGASEFIADGETQKDQFEKRLHSQARDRDTERALVAIDQLASYKSVDTQKLLVKLTRNRKTEIRIAALDVLGDLKNPAALPHFKRALKNNHWPIRAAAIRALGKLRTKESVDALIEQLAKEKGRLKADLSGALGKLTGKALGYDQRHWKAWWTVNRERFTFTDRVAGIAKGGGKTTYYGIPVYSERIVFCVDISGSMSAGGVESRLDTAKSELTTVLRALKKNVKVNLIFFHSNVQPWQKKMVSLKTFRLKALEKIYYLKAGGGTNLYDSLETAFKDREVDTIYVLSDGAPSAGKFTRANDILREIRKKNRARQIAIHTISLGRSDLMKKLAEQNGGYYVQR